MRVSCNSFFCLVIIYIQSKLLLNIKEVKFFFVNYEFKEKRGKMWPTRNTNKSSQIFVQLLFFFVLLYIIPPENLLSWQILTRLGCCCFCSCCFIFISFSSFWLYLVYDYLRKKNRKIKQARERISMF